MRTIFVPAIIDGLANVNFRCIKPGNRFGLYQHKYDPSWYTKTALFYHEHALTSYYISKKYKDFRKDQRMLDSVTLWADSGGYTIATKGVKIDPLDALKWQESNSNIAFTLDIPPVINTGVGRVSPGKNERLTDSLFERNAEMTRKNNLVFINNRKRKDLLIYNVIHGYDIRTQNIWWDYVASDIKFEGYAGGLKPTSDCLLQAMCIMHLYDKGIRERFHLLGVAGITVIPVLVWASQYIDKISFDSTSYGYGSRTRAYMYPERIRYYTHFGKKYAVKERQMKEIYCKCPICKDFKDPSYFIGGGSTWPGMLLALHNLYVTKQYVEELDRTLNEEKDVEKFKKLVYQHTGKAADNAFHAINFIEDCIKMGFHKAYDLYLAHHNFNKPKYQQKKLI